MNKFKMDDIITIYKLDTLNWVMAETRTVKKGKRKGEETETILGYYRTFFDAIKDYRNKIASESIGLTLDGYLAELKWIDARLAATLSGWCAAIESNERRSHEQN